MLLWQQGHGSQAVFDVSPTGGTTFWLPVLVSAFLFGLSMDDELIDAMLVRALLAPATVSLFGRWNWWLARVLRVEPAR